MVARINVIMLGLPINLASRLLECLAEAGDCRFYNEVQDKMNCNEETDYPIAYGLKYCNRFKEVAPAYNKDVRKIVFELVPWILGQTPIPHYSCRASPGS